jgi:hypothetical protein
MKQKMSLVMKLQTVLLIVSLIGLLICTLASCTSTRQNGCYDTRHLVGYK